MRRLPASIVLVAGFSLLAFACSDAQDSSEDVGSIPVGAGRANDPCAPGNAEDEDEQPDARCTFGTEYHVPDMTDAPVPTDAESVTTSSLELLDGLAATMAPSCVGGAGAGITSCGTAGNDDCCRVATVPKGKAGKITIAKNFGLGVYEVTSGRFASFVDATDGNLRGAAASGKFPGWKAEWTNKLPSTRAEVDTELGSACKFRSRIDDYGARTWPDPQITQTVASLITDDNARAADIRADTSPERLHAKPIDCVTYYMAAAFCAWDGGRLPTNDEWAYAALGGSELREYPWGNGRTADKLVTDLNHDSNASFTFPNDFPYFGNGMNAYHIAPPGNKPAGAAKWGHQDMGGNVLEWVADIGQKGGIVRGGSWEGHKDKNSETYTNYALDRSYGSLGIRCAYGDGQAPPVDPPTATTRPIYRAFNAKLGDHLQGIEQGEGGAAYKKEGVSFKVYTSKPAKNGSALYRCRNGQHHFLSNKANCEGKTSEGMLGYVLTADTKTTKPIYRCSKGKDQFSTLTPAECKKANYKVEGTQGFAIP